MVNDDEIRFIRHRYKVITLLVSARKINNNNETQQPQKKIKNVRKNVKVIRTKYKLL